MTPDEIRSAIAANPQTPTERARIINEAIENNMADEIPDDWGIGIGQGPDEPLEKVVHNYAEITTTLGTIYLMTYTDGTLVFENENGNTIYEFSNEASWANNELLSLEENLKWGLEVATRSRDLVFMLGERPIDPTLLLHTWQTGITGPGGSPAIIVGINAEYAVTLRIQDQLYPITDLDELDDAIDGVDRIYNVLRSDYQ